MSEFLDTAGEIIKFQTKEEVDMYAEKKLRSAFYEFQSSKKIPLADLRWIVNGEKRLSLIEAILEFEELKTLEVHFFKPNMKANWDYDRPTKKIVLLGRGLGGVETFYYDSLKLDKWDMSQGVNRSKVMIRSFFLEYYYPRSIKSASMDSQDQLKRFYIPRLMSLEDMWQEIRRTGIVPFAIRVILYTQRERLTYNFDLVNSKLLKDFRAGRISVKGRIERSPMDNYNFDRILASSDMKPKVKKIFITLYDMEYATASDISHSFGMTDTMARNCLEAIVSRGYASKEGSAPMEVYEINSNNLKQFHEELEE